MVKMAEFPTIVSDPASFKLTWIDITDDIDVIWESEIYTTMS